MKQLTFFIHLDCMTLCDNQYLYMIHNLTIFWPIIWPFRSSRRRCSVKKGVLKNFAKFTGKHLCQSLFLNKVAGDACNFIKKEILAQVFSCEFSEIYKNTFLTEHLRRLLLTSLESFWITSWPCKFIKSLSEMSKIECFTSSALHPCFRQHVSNSFWGIKVLQDKSV